jgi:hypothetical protein
LHVSFQFAVLGEDVKPVLVPSNIFSVPAPMSSVIILGVVMVPESPSCTMVIEDSAFVRDTESNKITAIKKTNLFFSIDGIY